jgi:type IX secretion system PorP/SprF family membrane protein
VNERMKKSLFSLFFISQQWLSVAQQLPLLTQNTPYLTVLNPAALPTEYFSDYEKSTVVGLSGRWQWTTQIPDAPKTYLLRADHRLKSPKNAFNLLLGGHILQDALGPIAQTEATLRLGAVYNQAKKGGFSMGLMAGYNVFRLDASKINLRQATADIWGSDIQKTGTMSIGVGFTAYLHLPSNNTNVLYAGFSVPSLYSPTMQLESRNTLLTYQKVPHYHAFIGHFKHLGTQAFIQTTVTMRSVAAAPIYLDCNTQLHLNQAEAFGFIGGLGFSNSGRLHTEIGCQTTTGFYNISKIIFSIDKPLFQTSLFNNAVDAYEISLIYALGSPK